MSSVAIGKPQVPEYRSKLEAAYAEVLQGRLLAGEIRKWWYEDLQLRIGFDCRLTVDFFVHNMDCVLEAHEVKGPKQWEDSIVKLRAAADKFPLVFKLVTRSKDGVWNIKTVGSSKDAEISAERSPGSAPLPNTAMETEHRIRNPKMRVKTPPSERLLSAWRPGDPIPNGYADFGGKLVTREFALDKMRGDK